SQSGFLQQRTAEMLLVFGTTKLQSQMSQQLGVDIVTVQQSTRQPDQSALVVGKYLNSRTLLKYEQNLENASTYLINLEYYLTKRIKLETYIDQSSETGAEINWSKDY
ncbi:MAG: translocation/assembly module TamB domain-containing protein, partial [Candidatus Krumholzibacteria bacterium]|nr:translocation/assembly module TamB domain-containing protein [Candidatus Krumholzibacteria bacterium]